MKCICCNEEKNLANSHVISNFIRKKIAGEKTENGIKYKFSYVDRPDLPSQDLPKPKLLCMDWDNKFGESIEGPASSILIPKGDPGNPLIWETLPIRQVEVTNIGGQPLYAGHYYIEDDTEDCALSKFTVLTAWRALHAMNAEGDLEAVQFLDSEEGKKLNCETIQFLKEANSTNYSFFPYHAKLYWLGPRSATVISGANDEIPFAWTIVTSTNQVGVAVMLGYWVILWSLRHDNYPSKFSALIEPTFFTWHSQVSRQLREYRLRNKKGS